jgi:hypothetical protein
VSALLDNPLARREWRALAHQGRDWRLWVGLRMPKDVRGWGLPAVVWFCLAPYVVWAALAAGHRVAPQYFTYRGPYGPTVDVLALCLALLGVYVCLVAVALMAPALAREREKETWDALRTTVTSPREIVFGLMAGRLAPLLAAYLAAGLFWVLARPHYAPLLQPHAPFLLDRLQVALLVAETAALALAAGALATAASAWCRTTGKAVVLSVTAVLLLGVLLGLGLALSPPRLWPAVALLVPLAATAAAVTLAVRRVQ